MATDPLTEYEERRRLGTRALLVGLAAGLVAVAFRLGLEAAADLRGRLAGAGWWATAAAGAASAAAAVWLVRRLCPEAAGSGIPHVERVIHGDAGLRPGRVLGVKFAGGLLAMGGGLALGREGPIVQMGAAVGQAAHRLTGGGDERRRALVAAGAGAGLAAAFNAPLAGLLFVLEELVRRVHPAVLTAAFVACVGAVVVTRPVTGPSPVFAVARIAEPPLLALPWFLGLGALAGLLGVAFDKLLTGGLDLFDRVPGGRRRPGRSAA